MATILTDDMGNGIPQYVNNNGTGFEQWRGERGHGNVRSNDGEIASIGSKKDPKATDSDSDATVISLLKAILDKPSGGGGGGSGGEIELITVWEDHSHAGKGATKEANVTGYEIFSIMGYVSAAATIRMSVRAEGTNFSYRAKEIVVPDAGMFFETFQIPTNRVVFSVVADTAVEVTLRVQGKKG